MQEYLEIGKIVNTHGIKGEVKVIPLTDDPQRFSDMKWVFIDSGLKKDKYNIEEVKYFKGNVLLKFKEVKDMDTAEKLKNKYLLVDRQNALKLPEHSFFICDLIDCKVFDMEEKQLGILKNVIKTGSNDVYVVYDENNKELLIPALKSVVKEISVEDKIIKVLLPKGLVDNDI